MKKEIQYFLNGKRITYEDLRKRKNKKLSKKYLIEQKHYQSPLTKEEEEEQKQIDKNNELEFFRKQRQMQAGQDLYHG